MSATFRKINNLTGFANGDIFPSIQDVLDYFTVKNMRTMFADWDSCPVSQVMLDCMAEIVIMNRWHCNFSEKEETLCFPLQFTVLRESVPGYVSGIGHYPSIQESRKELDSILDSGPDMRSNSFSIAVVSNDWDGFDTPAQKFHNDFCFGVVE